MQQADKDSQAFGAILSHQAHIFNRHC